MRLIVLSILLLVQVVAKPLLGALIGEGAADNVLFHCRFRRVLFED